MKHRPTCMKVILPTQPLVHRFNVMHQPLLDKITLPGRPITTWKQVAEYIIGYWVQYTTAGAKATVRGTAFEYVYDMARVDFIETSEATIEPDDADALRKVIRSFIRKFFDQIIWLIEQFTLTDYQLQTLIVEPWLANSMVLCVYA